MKCHGCGHEFPNTTTRCPRCHRSTSRRGRTGTDSRLLEFPRRTRVAAPVEVTAPALPAWRIELNEKVRAIRAKRDASSLQSDVFGEERTSDSDFRASLSSASQGESRVPFERDTNPNSIPVRTGSTDQPPSSANSTRRSSNNIVEAALTRVKRASENASRAALPKIEPARPIQSSTQVALAVDRQATARALEPDPEIESRVEFTPAPKHEPNHEIVQPLVTRPLPVEPTLPEKRRLEPVLESSSAVTELSRAHDIVEAAPLGVIDEIEPLDYLEAEVRKVDKALGAEFLRNESPSIFIHAIIGVVDLLAVAVSCSPFLATISIADGSFSTGQTWLASIAIVGLISFFYLSLTQCLCGRTFGMMLTNTRVVDALTFEPPSAPRALLRTSGYFIAAAPAMMGFIWAAFNRKHRGWQDFISGTVVVRDF